MAEMKEEQQLYLYCWSRTPTSFTASAYSPFQSITSNELAYEDGVLCTNFLHVGHVHWTSSGSVGNCALSRSK